MRYYKEKIFRVIAMLFICANVYSIVSCTVDTDRRHPEQLNIWYYCEVFTHSAKHYFTLYNDSLVCSTDNPNIPVKVLTAKELGIDLQRLIQVFYYNDSRNLTLDFSLLDVEKHMEELHGVVFQINGQYLIDMIIDRKDSATNSALNTDFWTLDSLIITSGLEYDKFIENYEPHYHHGDEINQLNSKGQKTGKWVTYGDYKVMVSRYKRGVLDGLFEVYNDAGLLTYTMIYKEGEMIGPSYSFSDSNMNYAHLGIQNNSDSIHSSRYDKHVAPDKQAFAYDFFCGIGELVSSGTVCFNEDDTFYPFKITTPVDIKEYKKPSDYRYIKQFTPHKIQ